MRPYFFVQTEFGYIVKSQRSGGMIVRGATIMRSDPNVGLRDSQANLPALSVVENVTALVSVTKLTS